MNKERSTPQTNDKQLAEYLSGKSQHTQMLFNHFISRFLTVGELTVQPTKSMIGISNTHKRIAWVTQLGKNFVHVAFPFKQAYPDNLCFQKIAQVPGQQQYNHHFRMYLPEDVNEEIMSFMQLAYRQEQ